MITRFLILILFSFLLSSCSYSVQEGKFLRHIKYSQEGIEDCYLVEGLFDHFPKCLSDSLVKNMKSCIPTKTFDPESVYSANLFLLIKTENNLLEFYPDSFIYKTNYHEINFIIDDSFGYYKYYNKEKIRNVVRLGAYPIPYFENFNFDLGYVRTDLRNSGVFLINDKYNVPEDLEVFVLKAESGYFWRLNFDQERPESLGKWKNGYSCGIAISKGANIAVYWMMAW